MGVHFANVKDARPCTQSYRQLKVADGISRQASQSQSEVVKAQPFSSKRRGLITGMVRAYGGALRKWLLAAFKKQ